MSFFSNPFHRDPNTPHRTRVWGTCNTWATKTEYTDGTVYYTCEHRGCKDNFVEHAPSYTSPERRKQPDRPLHSLEGDGEQPDVHYQDGRDPLKGRKRHYHKPATCPRCQEAVQAEIEEDIETGFIRARCPNCGAKLGPQHMQ